GRAADGGRRDMWGRGGGRQVLRRCRGVADGGTCVGAAAWRASGVGSSGGPCCGGAAGVGTCCDRASGIGTCGGTCDVGRRELRRKGGGRRPGWGARSGGAADGDSWDDRLWVGTRKADAVDFAPPAICASLGGLPNSGLKSRPR